MGEAPITVVGVKEAAELCGTDPVIVRRLLEAGKFPEPHQYLAQGEVWLLSQIEEYLAERPSPERRPGPRPQVRFS